jgi:hypothetical protein
VTLGPRTIEGALQAAFGFVLFQKRVLPIWIPWIVNHVQPFWRIGALPSAVQFIVFGLAALTYVRHPEGLVEAGKQRPMRALNRLFGKGKKPEAPPPADTPSTEVAAV